MTGTIMGLLAFAGMSIVVLVASNAAAGSFITHITQ